MAILGGILDLDRTLNGILGGGGNNGGNSSGNSGGGGSGAPLLTPIANLVDSLIGGGGNGNGGGSGSSNSVLDLGILNEQGVVSLNLLGQRVVVLPNNGGIVSADLVAGLDLDNITGSLTGITELGGLLGESGLLDLTGLLEDGVIDLGGILGEVLDLLGLDGLLGLDAPLDPDGAIDPDAFDHQLIGTAGHDQFTVPADGSVYIHGQAGRDTATFARSAENMSFAVGKDAVLFASEDTLYYFQDVERVEFFEGTLYLDTGDGENAGMAYRLYQAAFDRLPDATGLEYWIDRLDTGTVSLAAIADSFIHSPEFIRTFGTVDTVSNAEFVELLYRHTLDRGSDGQGFDYWVDRLDTNQTNRGDLLAFFSESEENQLQVAAQIENGIWIA